LIRWIAPSIAAALCLWPVAAVAKDSPFTQPALAAEQVRDAFSGAGFQVDQTVQWDWTSPPNSTFQVHDPTHGRVLMVVVYASATAAETGLLQARAREQAQHPGGVATAANGPHLITGYGESVWRGNVALVQTTQAELDRLFQLQNDRDNCVYVDPDAVQQSQPPSFAVDLDFQQALDNHTEIL
jgi:hypothetical protein